MNGRVYDYNLGRFLSVDPVIQFVGNSQGINPYSYIMNNPMAGTDPSGYVIDTIWDVGNVIFDVGKIAYGAATGNDDMVSEGLTDLAVDAAAAAIPFVPAGSSKLARAGAEKVADARQASKKTDTTPTTQKSESSSNTDGGSKGNGAETSQSASSSKSESTSDIGNQDSINKQGNNSTSKPIHEGKQGKHQPGHNNFQEGKSEMTHDNPQKLVDEHAGSGQQVGNKTVGEAGSKERVNFGENIGNHVDQASGTKTPTNVGIIHHSKNDVHIVPAKPEDIDK